MSEPLPRKVSRIVLDVWETKDYGEEQIRRDLRRFFGARGAYLRLLGHVFTSAVEDVDTSKCAHIPYDINPEWLAEQEVESVR